MNSPSSKPTVFLLTLSENSEAASEFTQRRYPDCDITTLSKRELRERGWKGQLKTLAGLRGRALVIFAENAEEVQELLLLKLTPALHHCKETVIADSLGYAESFRKRDLFRLVPSIGLSAFLDGITFAASSIALALFDLLYPRRKPSATATAMDVAFLYPYPMDRSLAGGAMTHVTGFLSGLAHQEVPTEVFSGRPLPVEQPVHEIPATRKRYLFRESLALSYNLHFAAKVFAELSKRPSRTLYQRHGRFVVVGALLARRLGVPLVLEYNGSELWITKHWDRNTRFRKLLDRCERISLAAASLIVVVSEPLRQELLGRGIPAERILVNPNAVNPEKFTSDCGGKTVRRNYGISDNDVVVGFVGSFSYWHGIPVLQKSIEQILEQRQPGSPRVRFLLIGQGNLLPEMQSALERYTSDRSVVFVGPVLHDDVPSYLDAADILVSPHVPMPDGKPFFGSPTKLFEYMAMRKAIVASDLDQLSQLIRHGETGWLVAPGDAAALANAITSLASDPASRSELGERARAKVLAEHTWSQNAQRVLGSLSFSDGKKLVEVKQAVCA